VSHRPSSDDAIDLRTYVDVLRRRWRVVAAITLGVLLLAALYSFSRPVLYTGEAEVLVDPGRVSSAFRPDQLVSIETEARLAASASVAAIAKRDLDTPASIEEMLDAISVETTPDSLVLDVSFSAPTPQGAADGANAFARAYLNYRRTQAEARLAGERDALQTTMDGRALERDAQNEAMDAAAEGSVEFRNARSRRDILNQEIAVLASQLTQIPLTVDPGELILPATPEDAPSSPNHPMNLALGLFLGLFGGVVGAFVKDRMDDRIGTRMDLESVIGAPTLSLIPSVMRVGRHRGPFLVTEQQPRSPAAEAYRLLRTSVMSLGRQRDLRVIGVTGAVMGEGKTTTVANLSIALALADQNVLAISADLRRPMLHEYFGLPVGPGLSEVLSDEIRIEEVLTQMSGNLRVVVSGEIPARPAELLQSRTMAEIVHGAREAFDFVIIDLPPVLGLADTLAVAPLLDGLLFVAHADKTRQAAVRHAFDQLAQVGAVIDGGVLNNVSPSRLSELRYGYGYGYDYGPTPSAPAETRTTRQGGSPRARVEEVAERAPSSNGSSRPRVPTHPENVKGEERSRRRSRQG
jgi:polysaccharide biosynthesis transport protein